MCVTGRHYRLGLRSLVRHPRKWYAWYTSTLNSMLAQRSWLIALAVALALVVGGVAVLLQHSSTHPLVNHAASVPNTTLPAPTNLSTSTSVIASSSPESRNLTSDGQFHIAGSVVYDGSFAIPGADPRSFKILYYSPQHHTKWYESDNAHVYLQTNVLPGADPSSFRIIYEKADGEPSGYAVDRKHAYYFGDQVPNADPATFSVLLDAMGFATAFATDSRAAYMNGIVIPGADPRRFALIPDSIGSDSYAKDGTHVYTTDFATTTVITGADPSSFSIIYSASFPPYSINGGEVDFFAEDKNTVYFDQHPMRGVDKTTFSPLYYNTDSCARCPNDEWNGYSKDRYHVYYLQNVIPGADAASFTIHITAADSQQGTNGADAKDRYHLYSQGKVIQ
ncbi:MAG: hypothetical protein B7X04_02835 [Parcubacteria group bacterium 21-54-25]|nr:MAG: hypothetical protein B7X04_02835 [Parcubacteria group bacterium 21-54-25]